MKTLSLTPNAIKRIEELRIEENAPVRLRISVHGGGCSGFQYAFTLDELVNQDDQLFGPEHAQVVIDDVSLDLLDGGEIDYVEDLSSAMFVIKNPNSSGGCGCGNSFSI